LRVIAIKLGKLTYRLKSAGPINKAARIRKYTNTQVRYNYRTKTKVSMSID
jgi:hypothetical protein